MAPGIDVLLPAGEELTGWCGPCGGDRASEHAGSGKGRSGWRGGWWFSPARGGTWALSELPLKRRPWVCQSSGGRPGRSHQAAYQEASGPQPSEPVVAGCRPAVLRCEQRRWCPPGGQIVRGVATGASPGPLAGLSPRGSFPSAAGAPPRRYPGAHRSSGISPHRGNDRGRRAPRAHFFFDSFQVTWR